MSGTIIDDADSTVVYSGHWTVYTDFSAAYDGTLHGSNTINDQATFTFQGVGILVNSGQESVGPVRARSSYSIDGGTPTVYNNDSSQTTSIAYTSPTLPNGQHTLVVINLDGTNSLFIDYFLVFSSNDTSESSTSSSSSSSSSTSTTTQTGTTVTTSASVSTHSSVASSSSGSRSSTTTSTSATTSTSDTSTKVTANANFTPSEATGVKSQIPLIVGPVFGAIIVCGVIYLLLRFGRRRNQKEPDREAPAAFVDLSRSPPTIRREIGEKPSSFLRDSTEPPPYTQDPQPSPLITSNRQPSKFRTDLVPQSSSDSPTSSRQPFKFRTDTQSSSYSPTSTTRQPRFGSG